MYEQGWNDIRKQNYWKKLLKETSQLFILIVVMFGLLKCSVDTIVPDKIPSPAVNHKIEHYKRVFTEYGSPVPEQMAHAVSKTKRQHIMAAMAIVESNGTPWAVGKSGEKGAFQVIESDWGKVSSNPSEQARQAERILEELLKTKDLRTGLACYNGGSSPSRRSYIYADKILKIARKIYEKQPQRINRG